MKKTKTPELDKMLAVQKKSQVITEFLKWLGKEEIVLGEWTGSECRECDEETFMNITMNGEQLLAKFFEIDLDKCEQERRQILADLKSDGR